MFSFLGEWVVTVAKGPSGQFWAHLSQESSGCTFTGSKDTSPSGSRTIN